MNKLVEVFINVKTLFYNVIELETGLLFFSHIYKFCNNVFLLTMLLVGMSKDELFGHFFAALEKIHFFRTMPDGNDDPVQLEKTTQLFQDALSV